MVLRDLFLQWWRLGTVLDQETTLACEKRESFQSAWSKNTPLKSKLVARPLFWDFELEWDLGHAHPNQFP